MRTRSSARPASATRRTAPRSDRRGERRWRPGLRLRERGRRRCPRAHPRHCGAGRRVGHDRAAGTVVLPHRERSQPDLRSDLCGAVGLADALVQPGWKRDRGRERGQLRQDGDRALPGLRVADHRPRGPHRGARHEERAGHRPGDGEPRRPSSSTGTSTLGSWASTSRSSTTSAAAFTGRPPSSPSRASVAGRRLRFNGFIQLVGTPTCVQGPGGGAPAIIVGIPVGNIDSLRVKIATISQGYRFGGHDLGNTRGTYWDNVRVGFVRTQSPLPFTQAQLDRYQDQFPVNEAVSPGDNASFDTTTAYVKSAREHRDPGLQLGLRARRLDPRHRAVDRRRGDHRHAHGPRVPHRSRPRQLRRARRPHVDARGEGPRAPLLVDVPRRQRCLRHSGRPRRDVEPRRLELVPHGLRGAQLRNDRLAHDRAARGERVDGHDPRAGPEVRDARDRAQRVLPHQPGRHTGQHEHDLHRDGPRGLRHLRQRWPARGHDKEGTKIIPDGYLCPGAHVEYFLRRSTIENPSAATLLFDTTRVLAQGAGNDENDDAERWASFDVLPDLWKSTRFGGTGLACLLMVDGADGLGSDPAYRGAADSLGFGRLDGAAQGWHVVDPSATNAAGTSGRGPNNAAGFVAANLGQYGLSLRSLRRRGRRGAGLRPRRGAARGGSPGDGRADGQVRAVVDPAGDVLPERPPLHGTRRQRNARGRDATAGAGERRRPLLWVPVWRLVGQLARALALRRQHHARGGAGELAELLQLHPGHVRRRLRRGLPTRCSRSPMRKRSA